MPEKTEHKPTRKSDRLQHELLVAFRAVDGVITVEGSFTGWAVNISNGGCFINTPKPLAVGSQLKLIVSLPDTPAPYELRGKVVRVVPYDPRANVMSGMGIEFVDVDEEKKARLERFVSHLRAELPDDDQNPRK